MIGVVGTSKKKKRCEGGKSNGTQGSLSRGGKELSFQTSSSNAEHGFGERAKMRRKKPIRERVLSKESSKGREPPWSKGAIGCGGQETNRRFPGAGGLKKKYEVQGEISKTKLRLGHIL